MVLPTNEWLEKARALTRRQKLAEATAAIQRALERVKLATPVVARRPPAMARRPVAATRADRPAPAAAAAREDRAAAGFLAGTHVDLGLQRAYKLFVPTRLVRAPSLVVMLHGCTQSPDDFATGTRMNAWAERQGFLVLYPAQSRSANASACWNWYQSADQQRDRGEVGLIASMTRRIVDEWSVDPSRVYAAGLSAGGAMAANLAAAYPDRFAAIGVHSGLVAGAANNVVDALGAMRDGARPARTRAAATSGRRPVPTVVFHGDRDATVHPRNADQVVAAALEGATIALHEVDERPSPTGAPVVRHRHRDASGMVQVEQWVLHGAGHAWAGGDPAGTHTDPAGVDATAELLRFFEAHRLVEAVA